jgi:hypothetical protein
VKSFWKITFIIAGVMLALGISFCIVGAAFGGRENVATVLVNGIDWMNMEKAGGETEDEEDDWTEGKILDDMQRNGHEVIREAVYENMAVADNAQIDELKISLTGCKFTLRESESEQYGIRTAALTGVQCYVEKGCLNIQGFQKKNHSDAEVTLYIPKEASLQAASFELGAGEFCLGSIQADEVSLQAGAGRIVIDRLQADDASLELGAGSMEILSGDIADAVISVGMGQFSYEGAIEDALTAECGMGNVRLCLDGSMEDYSYHTECFMGSLYLDGKKLNNAEHTAAGGEKQLGLSCAMGEIRVVFQ